MICKKCGAEIADASKFCPECGAATDQTVQASPEPQEQDKGSFFHRWGFLIILIGVALFVFIRFVYPNTEAGKAEQAAATAPDSAAASITPEVEKLIKASFGANYTLALDADAVTIKIWANDITQTAVDAKSGSASALREWESITDSATDLRSSIQGVYDAAGSSVTVRINIGTDRSSDDVIFAVSKSGVVFDYVDQ